MFQQQKVQLQRSDMIDSQQIQQLLKATKLNSINDVIHFILQQIYKTISFQPIQQLSLRISELEKPQGLDNIMLEEVKTLIQAILEQKEEQIRRDLQKTVHSNVSIAMQHEHTRRSLREFDLMEIMTNQNCNKRASLSSQQKSNSSALQQQMQLQIDSIRKQISQIKLGIERKIQKRQFTDFKIQMQKQISNKMTINETQKIVQKFQKDVFSKLSDNTTMMQRMDYQLKRSFLTQANAIKKQLLQSCKMSELKQKICKTEKRIKKIDIQINTKVSESLVSVQKSKKQNKETIEQLCNVIENLDIKLKNNSEQVSKIQQRVQELQQNKVTKQATGCWIADIKSYVKNNCICWEKECFNDDKHLYKYETSKTQIVITQSGYYIIQCYVMGTDKTPEMIINGQVTYQFQQSVQSTGLIFKMTEIVKLAQNCKLGIRLQGGSHNYNSAIIKISKLA